MSLVGSLEDLGLGDILQIVSLARKSGLLFLRAEGGDGRIIFESGLVRAAYLKSDPETLAALLPAAGFGDSDTIAGIVAECAESGGSADERDAKVAESAGLSVEKLRELCRAQVERVVYEMFRWRTGEFSFDVCDDLDARAGELALAVGINAQYLTMEATRLGDEGGRAGTASAAELDLADGLRLSGDTEPDAVEPAPDPDATGPIDPRDILAAAAVASAGPSEAEAEDRSDSARETRPEPAPDPQLAPGPELAPDPQPEPAPVPAPELAARFEEDTPLPAASTLAPAPPPARQPVVAAGPSGVPLVVIDVELMALEWLKQRLAPLFTRIHIFQHSEGGVARIRQYLGRGVMPVVLVSSHVPADSLTGAQEAGELVRRLRGQAPRMPILAMFDSDEEGLPQGLDAADAVLVRPSLRLLADARRRAESERIADELRRALAPWSLVDEQNEADLLAAHARREDAIAAVLRDPATQGEVLEHVLDFASERFSRVALFMVRDEEAVGIAQRRLIEAGGPTAQQFAELRIGLREPAWFREAIARAGGRCAAPSDAGDDALAAQLGRELASEAYIGTIHSGGHLAALLYADNLPSDLPCGDVGGMDAVLREAGLALERALLTRVPQGSG